MQKRDVNPLFLQHPREVKGRQRERHFSLAVKKPLFPPELLTKRFREKKRGKRTFVQQRKKGEGFEDLINRLSQVTSIQLHHKSLTEIHGTTTTCPRE